MKNFVDRCFHPVKEYLFTLDQSYSMVTLPAIGGEKHFFTVKIRFSWMSSGKKVQSPESWVQSLKFEVRRLMLSSEPGTGNPPQKRPCWCLYYWPVTKMRPSQSVFSSLVDRLTLGCAAKFSSRLFDDVKGRSREFPISELWTLDSGLQ